MAFTIGEKMKFKDRTKWIFAETLIEMAKEKSVEKIQVKELQWHVVLCIGEMKKIGSSSISWIMVLL